MIDEQLARVVGTPIEGVTHWGIGRIVAGRPQRLDHPGADFVRVKEWPIEQLTLEEVRARWGPGTYKIQWLSPENPDTRRRQGGWGPAFILDPENGVHVAAPASPTMPAASMPIATQQGGVSAGDLIGVMTRMIEMSDKRADGIVNAVLGMRGATPAADPEASREASEMRAELARMNARLDAEKRERELEAKHREELAKKDEEIRRLQREKEDAEREAERNERSEAPRIEPGSPVLSQLGYGIMNAAMAKPELVGKVVEAAMPFVSSLMGREPAQPPPAKSSQPGAPPIVPPPPKHGVPVVPADNTRGPIRTKAADPAPASPPPDKTGPNSSWQPIGNASKEPAGPVAG